MAEVQAVHSPAGKCPQCNTFNGELEDRCAKCGAALYDRDLTQHASDTARKLRQTDSHPDSPTKKDARASAEAASTDATPQLAHDRVPTAETQDDADMKAMMQRMMHMMGNLSSDMQSVKSGVSEAKETAKAAVTIAKNTEQQVSTLQKSQLTKQDVQNMIDESIERKLPHQRATTHTDMPTVLFGGMNDLSFDAAKDLVDTTLKNLQLPSPTKMYHKGDDFAGTLFAEFETLRAANEVVTKTTQSTSTTNKPPIWCKKDLPPEKRCPLSVLLGLRRQLITWGFNRRAIRVNDDDLSMAIERKPILAVTTCSDQVRLDWLDPTWKEWKELQDSNELKLLIDRANESLKTAASTRTKGEGKGKPTGTGQ